MGTSLGCMNCIRKKFFAPEFGYFACTHNTIKEVSQIVAGTWRN